MSVYMLIQISMGKIEMKMLKKENESSKVGNIRWKTTKSEKKKGIPGLENSVSRGYTEMISH